MADILRQIAAQEERERAASRVPVECPLCGVVCAGEVEMAGHFASMHDVEASSDAYGDSVAESHSGAAALPPGGNGVLAAAPPPPPLPAAPPVEAQPLRPPSAMPPPPPSTMPPADGIGGFVYDLPPPPPPSSYSSPPPPPAAAPRPTDALFASPAPPPSLAYPPPPPAAPAAPTAPVAASSVAAPSQLSLSLVSIADVPPIDDPSVAPLLALYNATPPEHGESLAMYCWRVTKLSRQLLIHTIIPLQQLGAVRMFDFDFEDVHFVLHELKYKPAVA